MELNKPYVLLDFNVIQYMKHKSVQKNKRGLEIFNGEEFFELVTKLSRKYSFPFCETHLRDLKKSANPGNEQHVLEDLTFMSNLSKKTALGVSKDAEQKIVLYEGVDIKHEFNKILMEPQTQQPINNIVGISYVVDMEKIDNDSIFKEEILKNNGVMDARVMQNVLKDMWENIDNPDYYNRFRRNLLSLRENLEKYDTPIKENPIEFEKTVRFLSFFEENDDINFEEKALEFCSWVSGIGGVSLDSMSLHYKIQNLYMLLSFHPSFSEKIGKKNRPSNVMRDCKVSIFGSSAEYIVTEDDGLYRKTKIVYKSLGITTKVTKMSEFSAKFL